jgi:hypothetical protein
MGLMGFYGILWDLMGFNGILWNIYIYTMGFRFDLSKNHGNIMGI